MKDRIWDEYFHFLEILIKVAVAVTFSNMIALKPKLKCKEIAVDMNEKDKKRKQEDQRRWENYFHAIVVDYFENQKFQSFHKDFDSKKDELDVFAPTYGSFMYGERNPGKRN